LAPAWVAAQSQLPRPAGRKKRADGWNVHKLLKAEFVSGSAAAASESAAIFAPLPDFHSLTL